MAMMIIMMVMVMIHCDIENIDDVEIKVVY